MGGALTRAGRAPGLPEIRDSGQVGGRMTGLALRWQGGLLGRLHPRVPEIAESMGCCRFHQSTPARPRPAAPSGSVSGPWPWDAPASTGLGVLPSPASMSPRAAVSLWVLTRAFSLSEAHQGKRSPPRPVKWLALGVQLRARGAGQPASGHPRKLPRHVAL